MGSIVLVSLLGLIAVQLIVQGVHGLFFGRCERLTRYGDPVIPFKIGTSVRPLTGITARVFGVAYLTIGALTALVLLGAVGAVLTSKGS